MGKVDGMRWLFLTLISQKIKLTVWNIMVRSPLRGVQGVSFHRVIFGMVAECYRGVD